MFARLESYVHRVRRRLSRSEWAIRHLKLPTSEGTSEQPGLLLIQIDGLARSQLEKALGQGRMPFLRRLRRRNGYELHDFYPGLPSTTPAVQAELFYGMRSAVPAFAFLDRNQHHLSVMFSAASAKERETACAAQGQGLLEGGSSWSNIYTGGAGASECHFCIATNALGDMWRTGKFRHLLLFCLLQFSAIARIFLLLFVEFFAAVRAALRGIRHGRRPGPEFAMILSRVFIATGVREFARIGGKIDLARGLPVVHINFVGYDEHAHRRGPGSHFALRSLRMIDRAVKELAREAQKSARRDYTVWIYSDHGQEHVRSFAIEHPGGVERIVREAYDELRSTQPGPRPPGVASGVETEGPRAWHRHTHRTTPEYFVSSPDEPFVLAAMGPVGHLYFREQLDEAGRTALARRLVEAGVPGVIVPHGEAGATWWHARGATSVPNGVPDLLAPHSEPVRREITRDLAGWLRHEHTGDLVLLGWSPWSGPWSFAAESGAHGGLGPEETRGFALLPRRTPLPAGTGAFIRPSALRQAALHHLGRAPLPPRPHVASAEPRLRVMTYNTHGCGGTDGRVSPRRIARIVREQMPDIVALQELDLGRRRSRAEDQAAIIAREAGLHAVFCPTLTRGEEHYGHALLSPWPIDVVKRARLPADPRGWWDEPRAAIWARVRVAGVAINVVTTHLGLGGREREAQMRALTGPDWIGGISAEEPVILCGDFNLLPDSVPYRIAARSLTDVQRLIGRRKPLNTFSSLRPMVRIDHIFLSAHFEPAAVAVVRNDLTRVASDHLPLVTDLQVAAAAAGKPSPRPSRGAPHNRRAPRAAGA
ncbi:MAG TPA: endonuclease/exonuclease/phosphatase family protein [Opitutaceae bacterium]|nr:endonuclease/exonuclease/phosphatase family protein [Opitutaceae bacterium]